MSLFKMKEDMAALGAEITALGKWIGENAGNPQVSIEDIKAKEQKRDELDARFQALKAEHDKTEKAERKKFNHTNMTGDKKTDVIKAKAEFYRAIFAKRDVASEIKAVLGAIPAGDSALGGGENLLPKTLEESIITEPMETNPMRDIGVVSNIKGLEKPKLDFTIDDDDYIDDKQVAKEIEMSGDKVSFGRFKSKIKAAISDSVYYGTGTDIVPTIENALRAGLAAKEKKVAFAESPKVGEEHMSFYSTTNAIKKIEGSTMYDAIVSAYGDLHDTFAENACVVMRRADYLNMIRDLSNTAESLFGKKPEDILGIPVKFVDKAIKPIVGDFRYWQINYDPDVIYDSDKDVDTGEFKFVVTAWYDIQIVLKSAFRVVSLATPSA
jgi:HK97 family phage major capsid protein